MNELLPGVFQIPVDYKGRPLKLYLLKGTLASLLMDTGDANIPQKEIIPAMQSIGFAPKDLSYIMITHPDLDHQGGLLAMTQAAPNARVLCGTADRDQIESPKNLIAMRSRAYYERHGLGPDDEAAARMLPRLGGDVPVDVTLNGGEMIRLSENWSVHVLHLPGHSRGHLGIYLPEHHTAIIADAVHGTSNAYHDGRPAFAPTYMYVDQYLETISKLELMNLKRLYSCHWPDCDTPEKVQAFLEISRQYAMSAEAEILRVVQDAGPQGLTLKDIILASKPALGSWPAERDMDGRYMVGGHLEQLIAKGFLSETFTKPARYCWQPRIGG